MSIVSKTLNVLRPKSAWSLSGENIEWVEIGTTGEYETPNFEWIDEVQIKPTRAEYEAEYAVQAELAQGQLYKFNRRREYPSINDLADAVYWQSKGDETKMEQYLAKVEAVKLKYPKV
jgi:hypothetical protein